MAESMKFGPYWIRNATSSDMPKCELANFRYGREEMLALYDKHTTAPEPLCSIPVLYVEDAQIPLALVQMTEEETLTWSAGINSDVTKPVVKSTSQATLSGMNSNALGRQMPNTRGRGRDSYVSSRSYEEGQEFMSTSFGKTRYDRIQGHPGERTTWPERNGSNEHVDWGNSRNSQDNNTSSSIRKDYSTSHYQSSRDDVNWRRRPWNNDDGRKIRYSEQQGRSNTARNWRDGGNERDRDKQQSDISDSGVRDRRWISRVPGASHLTGAGRKNSGTKDETLPEWVHENEINLNGTFDSSGAFHESNNSVNSADEDKVKKNESKKDVNIKGADQKRVKFRSNRDAPGEYDKKSNKREIEKRDKNLKDDKGKSSRRRSVSSEIDNGNVSNSNDKRIDKKSKSTDNSKPDKILDSKQERDVSAGDNVEKPNDVAKKYETTKPLISGESANAETSTVPVSSIMADGEKQKYDEYNGMVMDMVSKVMEEEQKPSSTHVEKVGNPNDWYYCDPQGKVQGPFSSTNMMRWYNRGFFDGGMLIRRACETHFYDLSFLVRLNKACPFMENNFSCGEQSKLPLNLPRIPENPLSAGQDALLLQQQQRAYLQTHYKNLIASQVHNRPIQENTLQDIMFLQRLRETVVPSTGGGAAAVPNISLSQSFVPPVQQRPSIVTAANPLLNIGSGPELTALLTHLQQQYYQRQIQELQRQQHLQTPVMPFYHQTGLQTAQQNTLQTTNINGDHTSVQARAQLLQTVHSQRAHVGNMVASQNITSALRNNPVVSNNVTFISNPMQNVLNQFNNTDYGHLIKQQQQQQQQQQQLQNVQQTMIAATSAPPQTHLMNNVVPTPIMSRNLADGFSNEVEQLWRNEKKDNPVPYENQQQRPLEFYLGSQSTKINSTGLWTGDVISDLSSIKKEHTDLGDAVSKELNVAPEILCDSTNKIDDVSTPLSETAAQLNCSEQTNKEKVMTAKKQPSKQSDEKPKKQREKSKTEPAVKEKIQKVTNKTVVVDNKKSAVGNKQQIDNSKSMMKQKEDKKSKEDEKKKKLEEDKRKKEEQHKKEMEIKKREEENKTKEEKERRRKIEEEKRDARELAKKEMLLRKEAEEEALRLEQQKKQEEALQRLRNQQLLAAAANNNHNNNNNNDDNTNNKLQQKIPAENKTASQPSESPKFENVQKKRQKNKQESKVGSTAWGDTKKVQPKSLSEIQEEEQKELMKKKELEKVERQRRQLEDEKKAAIEAAKLKEMSAKSSPWSIPTTSNQSYCADSFALPSAARAECSWSWSTQQKNIAKNLKTSPAKKGKNLLVSSATSNVKKDELYNWGVKALSKFHQSALFDIPTCIGFLRELNSAEEIKNYVYDFIGENKESKGFVSQFVQHRIRIDGPLDDYGAAPPPGFSKINAKKIAKNKKDITSSRKELKTKERQDLSNQKQTKIKKKQPTLKVDHTILGFSVTAATNRVNAGEIDYGEVKK